MKIETVWKKTKFIETTPLPPLEIPGPWKPMDIFWNYTLLTNVIVVVKNKSISVSNTNFPQNHRSHYPLMKNLKNIL